MRNSLFIVLFSCCCLAVKGTPDVSLQVNRFKSNSSAYIEISLYIVGSSLKCNPSESYGVNYTLLIRDENTTIVTGNHYRLTNAGCPSKDLIDLKRYNLSNGKYTVEIEMNDVLDTLNKINISQDVEILYPDPDDKISDIQLLSTIRSEAEGNSSLHKSGLYLEPVPFNYYYPALNFLNLYVESYDADHAEGQPFIRYTIKPATGEFPAPVIAYRKVQKESISANILQLDISKMISGPYVLEASLFDGNKTELTSKTVSFSRYNPAGDSLFLASGSTDLSASFVNKIPVDSIDYFLKALAPIVSSVDVEVLNTLLDKGNNKSKQFFLYRFWTKQGGKFAEKAFDAYMKVARVVDVNYRSGFGYGFETDRGHVFLKYGKPNDIVEEENDPSAPPYEIWFYNTFPATHQNNVRFLFYNPSLTKNGYKLLHSTAIGEVKNEKWEIELYRDATQETPGVNAKEMGDNVYRNARKYFEN